MRSGPLFPGPYVPQIEASTHQMRKQINNVKLRNAQMPNVQIETLHASQQPARFVTDTQEMNPNVM